MATTEQPGTLATGKRKPPKGGRKGGTIFPRIDLEKALTYAEKLVGKTHTGPLPEATILAGVFENAGALGRVRASALRQYNLLEGDPKGYQATELAKSINAAPEEEKPPHLQKAFLSPKVFQEIFTTFQDDTVTKAKIKQRTLGLKVHPDSAEECVEVFVESAQTAGLGTIDGDSIKLAKLGGTLPPPPVGDTETAESEEDPETGTEELESQEPDGDTETEAETEAESEAEDNVEPVRRISRSKGQVKVNLSVDPSSDPEKLEKQLKLLKRFGLL